MRVIHCVVIREIPPSKRPRIESSVQLPKFIYLSIFSRTGPRLVHQSFVNPDPRPRDEWLWSWSVTLTSPHRYRTTGLLIPYHAQTGRGNAPVTCNYPYRAREKRGYWLFSLQSPGIWLTLRGQSYAWSKPCSNYFWCWGQNLALRRRNS